MRVMFNMEHERVAGLDAPTIFEFIKSEEERQVLGFFSSSMELGRPLMAPPGVPAERVARLRAAFDAVGEGPGLPAGGRRHGLRGRAAERRGDRRGGRHRHAKAIVDQAQRASTGE